MRTRRTPFYGMPEDLALLPESERERFRVRNVVFDEVADVTPEMLAKFDGADIFPQGMEVQTSEGETGHVSGVDPETGIVTISAGQAPAKEPHPDYREKGIDLPLGFVPSRGENRRQRREAVAKWTSPADAEFVTPETAQRVAPIGDKPRMPTRRELWAQRQRQRRGTLDPELRRLQRRKAVKNGRVQ
jgi:hypothetical protein